MLTLFSFIDFRGINLTKIEEINGLIGKKCTKCGEWKPLDFFHKSKTSTGGRLPKCKECRSSRTTMKTELETIDGVIGKKCSKCNQWNPLDRFHRKKKCIGGVRSECMSCTSEYKQSNKERTAEYHKEWYSNNKKWKQNYYQDNKERIFNLGRQWRAKNIERVRQNQRKYNSKNRYKIKAYYTKNAESINKRKREYYQNNKEKFKSYNLAWRKNNYDKVRKQHIKYVAENKEKIKAKLKSYWKRKENLEKANINYHKRLARKKKLPDSLTLRQKEIIAGVFNNSCVLTGSKDFQWDHVIPLSIGHGGTIFENMIPLRSDLNMSKGNMNIFGWFTLNKERFNLEQDKFNILIEWLAAINGMGFKEYHDYVYRCHENPKDDVEL